MPWTWWRVMPVVLVLFGMSLASAFTTSLRAAEPATETTLQKALLEEAQRTYELELTRLRAGVEGIGAEDLYRWSRRWLDAQVDLAAGKEERISAFEKHLERMQDLEKVTKNRADVGQGRMSDASAGRYFRIQAELWLARAKAK